MSRRTPAPATIRSVIKLSTKSSSLPLQFSSTTLENYSTICSPYHDSQLELPAPQSAHNACGSCTHDDHSSRPPAPPSSLPPHQVPRAHSSPSSPERPSSNPSSGAMQKKPQQTTSLKKSKNNTQPHATNSRSLPKKRRRNPSTRLMTGLLREKS